MLMIRVAAIVAITLGVSILSASSLPSRQLTTSPATSDSSDVASVVSRYHDALATGDSATALSLLTDDALILESGGVETRADYRAHHLPADIAFARAIRAQRGPIRVRVRGDVAWTSSTSTTQGDFNGRAINSVGAESMVLLRESQTWRICSIHWSSRTRRSG